MKIKIAVVQFGIDQTSIEANLKSSERYIKEAKESLADIIVFPEEFLTGPVRHRKELILDAGKYLNFFVEQATKNRIDIVPGTIVERNKKGVFNNTCYIDKSGKIRGEYSKINLWHSERSYVNPGNRIAVFNTRFGKAGLVICWDMMFPEIFRAMVRRNVKLVFCPSFWTLGKMSKAFAWNKRAEANTIDSIVAARASENGIILAYSNFAGSCHKGKKKEESAGHTQVVAPFLSPVERLGHNREEMIVAEVDLDILKDHEKSYKIRADLRSGVMS